MNSFLCHFQQQQHSRHLQQQANRPVITGMASAPQQQQQQGHDTQETKLQGSSDYDKVLHQQRHEDSAPKTSVEAGQDDDDDLMSESYGEGYATRSSEEGFGGVYSAPVGGHAKGAKSFDSAEEEAEGRPWPHQHIASGINSLWLGYKFVLTWICLHLRSTNLFCHGFFLCMALFSWYNIP
jgi:hypothetical protein